MNINDMISKLNPKMLSEGLKKISPMLSQNQLAEMENAIKSLDKGELNSKMKSLSAEDLKKELENNPNLAKNLSQNKELMQKLTEIFNQKNRYKFF